MNDTVNDSNKNYPAYLKLKFIVCAGFGVFMFIFPIPDGDTASTGVNILTQLLDDAVREYAHWSLFMFVAASALGALLCQFRRPDFVTRIDWIRDLFCISVPYLITRLFALFVMICVTFEVGPEVIRSEDIGLQMASLSYTLIALAFVLSFVLPFLTESGIMEFTGIILKPLVRPLFRVPGRASVDLITSWLASSNTAVLITAEQYRAGYYSMRESATIMTNFSLVSIPFCMVVAETLKLSEYFVPMYAIVTGIGLFIAIISPRFWPLGTIPDSYAAPKKINEDVPQNISLFDWAIQGALERIKLFRLDMALASGGIMAVGIIFDLIPIVIAWGTVGTYLAGETSIFQWLSYPMGMYLSVLGVEDAFQMAPATLVGFIDMFIPCLITSVDAPIKIRFIVGVLSLVQIIYLTEVGSIIVKANVGLDIKKLFGIFLERTIIALPIIVFFANMMF